VGVHGLALLNPDGEKAHYLVKVGPAETDAPSTQADVWN